jgi:hypothetical protein
MSLDLKIMIDSYRNISFYGEKQGKESFEYYNQLLKSDLSELGENKGKYEEKFCNKVMNIFHKQSRCTSSFITGPANYDLSRHEKTWNSRDKAQREFDDWRARYIKRATAVKTLSPEAEIDKTIEEIEKLTIKRDLMKEFNKCCKSDSTKAEEILLTLYPSSKIDGRRELINEGKIESFYITSLTTKLRERRKKVLIMKNRIETKNSFETKVFNGGTVFIENDRVIISHDVKPSREIISFIKKYGFKWSPKMKNWCRKHTAKAIEDANYLLNNVLETNEG